MPEIDFDELDRAVNSLMNEAPQEIDKEDSGNQSKPAISSSQDNSGNKPFNNPTQQTINQPIPGRFGGKFMDVVPPSAVRHSQSSTPVSRVGASLELSPSSTEQQTPVDSENSADNPFDREPVNQLDNGAISDSEAIFEQNQSVEGSDNNESEELTSDIVTESPETPLESPFLPDAVVDKRPLGTLENKQDQIDDSMSIDEPANAEDSWGSEKSDGQLTPDILAQEYSKEMMALESQDKFNEPLSSSVGQEHSLSEDDLNSAGLAQPEESSEVADTPVNELSDSLDIEAVSADESATQPQEIEPVADLGDNASDADLEIGEPVVLADQATVPAGGDIPQQWTPTDDSTEPAPMFDAAADQVQQLLPVKKKSGWPVLLIIII